MYNEYLTVEGVGKLSYFAVLRDEDESVASYAIEDCHINFWCVATLPPRRRAFFLDVGLKIKAGQESVSGVVLSVPVASDAYADLAPAVKDRESSELIFDSPVTVSGDQIAVHGNVMTILTLRGGLQPDTRLSGPDLTVWKLTFNAPLAAQSLGYLRVRFRVTSPGRIWHWQPRNARHSGAILDFRVNDQRSAAFLAHGDELRERTIQMERTYLFVMVPAWLHGRTVHPQPRYARVLETTHWHRYLDRKGELNGRQLIVSYWKSGENESLRVYVDYVMGRRSHPWLTAVGAIALLSLVLGTVFHLPLQPSTERVLMFVQQWVIAPLLGLSGLALLGWVWTALRNVRQLSKAFTLSRRIYRWLDAKRYGKAHFTS